MNNWEAVFAVFFFVLLLWQIIGREILWQRERKDLYTRLMSRDISEYKRVTADESGEPRKSAHQKAINKWRSGKKG